VQQTYQGNAIDDGRDSGQWFIGQTPFLHIPPGIRTSEIIHIKWAVHKKGDARTVPTADADNTTVTILVSGKYSVTAGDKEMILTKPGDYAIWQAGLLHTWNMLEDSTVVTVRWREHA
jgi:hypothetical protein